MPNRWRVSPNTSDATALDAAVNVLRAGGVIAYPTDTLYGLGADASNAAAVGRVFEIKGRDSSQPIPLIAGTLEQVEAVLGPLTPVARRVAEAFWPGPLTLVVRAPSTLPSVLLGGGVTIGVRVPDHVVARALASWLGHPITSTSANRSAEPATADPDAVERWLGRDVDGIVDTGPAPGGPPSTIIDVSSDVPRLVRAGAVSWGRVVQFLSS
jgi:L-threonylcarbamoyladenylate synthase